MGNKQQAAKRPKIVAIDDDGKATSLKAERLEIGLTEGWVRMSVGLEGPGDLTRDVSRALDAA